MNIIETQKTRGIESMTVSKIKTTMGDTLFRKGTVQRGSCCITITHRVPVKRVCTNLDRAAGTNTWDYKLLTSKLKRILKDDIIYFWEQDAEQNDTFDLESKSDTNGKM